MVKKIRRYLYSFWHNSRTWQTHRQTDTHTDTTWRHRLRLCIASCGKNVLSYVVKSGYILQSSFCCQIKSNLLEWQNFSALVDVWQSVLGPNSTEPQIGVTISLVDSTVHVCLSVCLSVTCCCWHNISDDTITQFSPPCSPESLGFWYQVSYPRSEGNPPSCESFTWDVWVKAA